MITKNLSIIAGHTYREVIRWETEPIVRKPISGISTTTGAPRITLIGHGILDEWRVAITGCKGMTEINADDQERPGNADYHKATVIDNDTIELNDLSAGGYRPWTSGGFVQWNSPATLSGFSARLRVKDRPDGALLASNLVADSPLNTLSVDIDTTRHTITITFSSMATASLAGKYGVYDLELVSGDETPVVTQLVSGRIRIERE
jgi:hypothetical protein